jgi:histidinol-phosphatase (PHP family)
MKDGHIHTPFCPHGTKDSFEEYIEKAITLGFTEITFTEHAPLPNGFIDTTPEKDSAMKLEELDDYFGKIEQMKRMYHNKIHINCGLELDYIEGYETEITDFLNQYGARLDDAILSVHFLKHQKGYDCLDYSPDVFEKLIQIYGSLQAVYNSYFQTVLKSVLVDLGPYKPRRIGHITLVKKFQNRFTPEFDYRDEILQLLTAVKDHGYELDYNGAGTAKPLCRETYPPQWIAEEAARQNIPLIYGSDAHQVKELKQGFEQLIPHTKN